MMCCRERNVVQVSEILIELKNLSKIYPIYKDNKYRLYELLSLRSKKYHEDFYALKNINLSLKRGEIVGIIGKNGAGKSTLLKIITGILEPSLGEKNIKGKISALIELGAGFNPEYTGIENIYFYGITQGKTKEEMDNEIENIKKFADIGDFINQPVKNYSSGMFARLAFSVAVNVTPDILIVDEILSVGDVFFQNKCVEKMKELMNKGTLIIFVSHDMHAVKFFCDRIIYLNQGQILKDSYNVNEVLDFYEKGIYFTNNNEVFRNSSELIEILETDFLDVNNQKKMRFKVGEKLKVRIKYRVYKELKNIFLGFGFRNQDGIYISGVNTKLDKLKILGTPGEYEAFLEYEDINIYKGVYTTWSVFYNDTGTVVLADYIIKNAFQIYDIGEICEGVVNLKHKWYISEVIDD